MVKSMKNNFKSYSELVKLSTFEQRFEYLRLNGVVGKETFGYDRYLNQMLYKTREWKKVRQEVIIRDNGCDLGCSGFEIYGRVLIHHINPITVEDVINRSFKIFDPDNLIATTHNTHLAIHYGDSDLLVLPPMDRSKNDTSPWLK